jgi:hypothetical protein
VNRNREFARELVRKGYMSLPVTIIGEREIVGFDLARLQEALAGIR